MKKSGRPGENPGFDDYYREIYGSRWQALRESLFLPPASFAYGAGLLKPYMMDSASVLAASSLRLPPEGLILDACAAPGGKSLVIASRMGAGARLLSNELSSERRRRLFNVLDEHLPGEARSRVSVSGFVAASLAGRKSERERFDAVLLDVPCSGERHVIQSPSALSQWTPARPRGLARRQWALLSSAFLLLKPGGSLVYATCALAREENTYAPEKLLEKYMSEIEIDEPGFPEGEKTLYGRIILPDAFNGMGPMFVARFRKR